MVHARRIYVIGSLRNPEVTSVGALLRADGHEVFDDWMAAGPTADDSWQEYEVERGHDFAAALAGPAARHVFEFDLHWLGWADTVVLVCPAGKSGHLELGWSIGKGKQGYILLAGEPERYDVMYQLATGVYTEPEELLNALHS